MIRFEPSDQLMVGGLERLGLGQEGEERIGGI